MIRVIISILVIMLTGCSTTAVDSYSELKDVCIRMCTKDLKECNTQRGTTDLTGNRYALMNLLVGDTCDEFYKKEEQCLATCLARTDKPKQ